MRIALFATCLADTLFPARARATVTVLERLGHEVVFPAGADLLRADARQYRLPARGRCRSSGAMWTPSSRYEVIVAPSGSCVGSITHQHAMVARRLGDEQLAQRAEAVAARTYELSQLLIDVLGVEDVGAHYPHRVTYHPTCHSLRLLRVGDRPLRLLRHVSGHRAGAAAGRGGVLRVRRHVRGQER